MKILLIAPQPFYTDRGTPMNVRLLATVIGEAGYSVDILTFPTGEDIELTNVKIIRVPNIFGIRRIPAGPSKIKLIFDLIMIPVMFWRCMTKKYDVLHGIEEGGIMAVFFSKIFKTASVLDLDSWMSDQLRYSGFIKSRFILGRMIALEKWAVMNSSMVLTVCAALTQKVREVYRKANVVQIEDIPHPDINKYDRNEAGTLAEKYGLQDFITFIYTGNLEKYQGIDLLLDAWETFLLKSKKGALYKLVIVGGPEEKVTYYKGVARKKRLSDTVCWTGPRPVNEMGSWLAISDVLVSPRTEGENTPMKIFNYMASGRPIVATKKTTHTQVLDDTTAFLAEPDPQALSHAMMDAVTRREEARIKAGFAKKNIEEKYNYKVFSEKLLNAYKFIGTGQKS